jgi:hypothetical protein
VSPPRSYCPNSLVFPYDVCMELSATCPRCQKSFRLTLGSETGRVACPGCGATFSGRTGRKSTDSEETLDRCLVCGSESLFTRKDFPQRVGTAIVIIGFVASSVAYYFYAVYLAFGILFAFALVDVMLYLIMGDSVGCYRCAAEYRGLPAGSRFDPFRLEIHERFRQERARAQRVPQPGTPPTQG